MKNKFFYRVVTDPDNNFADKKSYLTINCTGHSFYKGEINAKSIRHDYYLMYLVNGTVRVNEPSPERAFNAGDIIIFEPENHYSYFKADGVDMEYYWIHFTGCGVSEVLKKCGLALNTIIHVGIQETICEDFRRLFNIFTEKNRFFEIESANTISQLLLDAAKHMSGSRKASKNHEIAAKAINYISTHISEPVTVEKLAGLVHMSVSRFRAVFGEITDLSPREYIIRLKLNYACELLRHSDESVQQISSAIGYDNPQYFSRLFKMHFKMPPSEYKKTTPGLQ